MFRNVRRIFVMLLAIAFMVSGGAAMAVAASQCAGCPVQMRDMGGKEKPSDDCMLKMACAAIGAHLPAPMPVSAAITYSAAPYPFAVASIYDSHHVTPPSSPPRLFT